MGNDEPYCPPDYPIMKTFQRAADWLRKDVPYVMELAARGQYAWINIVAGYQDAEERAIKIAEAWNS